MDTIIATFDQITSLAPDVERDRLDDLIRHIASLDMAAKAAISLGTITDANLVATHDARRRAVDATDLRLSQILLRQHTLINAIPQDRRSRSTLRPMSAPALLVSFIDSGADEVTHIAREQGDFVDALKDGAFVTKVDAYCVNVVKHELVVDGVGRWPLHSIEAVSTEDGFAFLLEDGTLYELQARG